MQFPANLKYTAEHEWLRIEGDIAYIGITDFAQSELGDIVYVEVDTVGQNPRYQHCIWYSRSRENGI